MTERKAADTWRLHASMSGKNGYRENQTFIVVAPCAYSAMTTFKLEHPEMSVWSLTHEGRRAIIIGPDE